jgi:hypothetical protein
MTALVRNRRTVSSAKKWWRNGRFGQLREQVLAQAIAQADVADYRIKRAVGCSQPAERALRPLEPDHACALQPQPLFQ